MATARSAALAPAMTLRVTPRGKYPSAAGVPTASPRASLRPSATSRFTSASMRVASAPVSTV
jgi:hypothetical protein